MSLPFHLIACSTFDRELQAVQASPDLRDIDVRVHPVRCDLSESPWAGLGETVMACRKDGCPIGFIGGYCLSRPLKDLCPDGSSRLQQESHCAEWVADKGLLERLLEDGGWPVLPGWLRDWQAHVEARFPSDEKAAVSFFRDVARQVVLLDT